MAIGNLLSAAHTILRRRPSSLFTDAAANSD
jgi:hypothetical protein